MKTNPASHQFSRRQFETAHHSAVPGHLGLIALRTGRKIRWDAPREVIVGNPEASKLLGREYRKPWSLG